MEESKYFIDPDLRSSWRVRVQQILDQNIIPFWIHYSPDDDEGGFYGRIQFDGTPVRNAPRGLILITRILWAFSALYRFEPRSEYLSMAQRAFVYMIDTFMDSEYGGVYWLVDPQGQVLDDKKRIYGQAFAIYSLSEYYAATQYPFALEQIQTLFDRIDTTCRDADHRGYLETFNRDWSVSETMQLSMVDMDEKKSMNTHLHLMEAYTRLFEIDPSPRVRERLGTLIDIFLETIIDSNTHHFQLFFDEFWNPKTDRISYGHDIEGAWLLWEAVSVLGDEQRKHRLTRVLPPLVNAVRSQAMNDQGGLYYETLSDGGLCRDVHWWTQAEAVVGFLDAFQHFGHIEFLESAQNAWSYIESHLIDWQYGEWIYKIPAGTEYKVSEWKGPYHNTRACLELLNRLS